MAPEGAAPAQPEGAAGASVRLARDLSLADATLLGVGALLGGGIFVLPGLAAGLAGPGVVLALALNALVTIPTLLVYAELASGFHDAGGGYLWVRRALGPTWGFLGGWVSWFSHAMACGVYALASAAYLVALLAREGLLPPGLEAGLAVKAGAVGLTVLFLGVHFVGVKLAARVENLVTAAVLGSLAVFLGFGALAVARRPEGLAQLHLGDASGFLPHGLVGVVLAMGLTFIAFEGYEIVAQASEEVRRPHRNVPLACILSVAIVSPLLVLVAAVALAAAQPLGGQEAWSWLAGHRELALVEAAAQFVPLGLGAIVVILGAMLSNVTALNSTIYSSSRVSFAMGRDRVLPASLARIHPRRQTPAASILLTGLIVVAMVAALPLLDVAAAADIMFLLLFTLVNVSYLRLRREARSAEFGFRAPFYPVLPVVGLATKAVLAVALFLVSPVAWLAALGWVAVGLGVHVAAVRGAARAAAPAALVAPEARAPAPRGPVVLLPLANPASVAPLAALAGDLAGEMGGEVVLLHIVAVPKTTLPSAVLHLAEPAKLFLLEAAQRFPPRVPARAVVKIAHDPAAAILETAEEEGARLILLGWRGRPSVREHVLGATIDPVVRRAPCDVAVLRDGGAVAPGRVVVAARGRGRHARLGAELAAALARARGAELVGLTVVTPHRIVEPEARLAGILADAGVGPWDVRLEATRAASAEEGLLAAAGPGTLLVLGASEEPAWRKQLFGTVPERVAARAEGAVLLAKRPGRAARLATRALARLRGSLAGRGAA